MLIRSRRHPKLLRILAPFALLLLALSAAVDASAESGGSGFVVVPKITAITCAKNCSGGKKARRVRGGGVIRVTGKDLDQADKFIFTGGEGKRDDIAVSPTTATPGVARITVPLGAQSGPVAALAASGVTAKAGPSVTVLPAPPVIAAPDLKSVATGIPGITLKAGTSTPRSVFLGAKKLVRYSFVAAGADNLSAEVALVDTDGGKTVASWKLAAPSGQTVSVDWNGKAGGALAAAGRYAFRTTLVSANSSAVDALVAPIDISRDAFDLREFKFPIRGKHTYGMGAGRFGGGRGHQGQDVLADCGLKLVAARGGIVRRSGNQGAAGNYIAITPDDAGVGDQAYLHLAKPSPFRAGDRVYTGQQIGVVGDTGRASACHLHFEQWKGEIWRSQPVDPLPGLKAWDLVS